MPKLRHTRKGASRKLWQRTVSSNISKFHKTNRFKKLSRKYGREKADKIAIAAGLYCHSR